MPLQSLFKRLPDKLVPMFFDRTIYVITAGDSRKRDDILFPSMLSETCLVFNFPFSHLVISYFSFFLSWTRDLVLEVSEGFCCLCYLTHALPLN